MRLHAALRLTTWVVIVTFTSLTMQPLSAAIQLKRTQENNAPLPNTADEKYATTLADLEDEVKRTFTPTGQPVVASARKDRLKTVRAYRNTLIALDRGVEESLAATGKHLEDKNLSQVIKDRHANLVRQYRDKRDELGKLMAHIDLSSDKGDAAEIDAALAALSAFFEKQSQSRKRAPLDPNNMPWRTPKSQVRQPIANAKGFNTALFERDFPKVAAVGTATGIAVPKTLSAAPTAEDLAETEDVQLTPAIRAKAAELGNHPLRIYQFVRNSVRFTPTYGSVQGAQNTLEKLSGNAFDISSLLIALYRAAGIPARYAYATIEVPADKLNNWVGGTANAEAAQQVLGQGGIPNLALVAGGKISAVRLEHMYVEAYLQYFPSRGAKHVAGKGDTWVPVDASFKQYVFTEGIDLRNNTAVDTAGFLAGAQQGATINQAEGWVQNLNQANVLSGLGANQNQLKAYVDSVKPNATLGDVFGKQTIVQEVLPILPGALATKIVAKGPTYSTLPESLRHQFVYRLYADAYSRNIDSPIWVFQRSLPRLAGKKMTLSFKPASQADADLIASYLPKPHADGTPIQQSEFPTSIPALARLTPELKVDGEVAASAGSFFLGSELAGQGGFTQYDFSGWDLTNDDTLVTGQTTAIGLSVQGLTLNQLQQLKSRLEQAKGKLESGITSDLNGDLVVGDLLTATVWAYLLSVQAQGKLLGMQARMVDLPGLTYGMFHSSVQPNKVYGGAVTTSVKFPGVLMDIGHLRHVRWSKDHDQSSWIRYNRMRGQAASVLEGIIPEMFFVDGTTCSPGSSGTSDLSKPACPQGLSAVRALMLAQAEGQKIYTITQANQQAINSLQLRSDTLDDIRTAVAAGKEVLVHERPVVVRGGSGAGYVIIDPQTGAGAYLIEGKANGGILFLFAGALLAVFGLFFLPAVAGILLLVYGLHLLAVGTIITFLEGIVDSEVLFAARYLALIFAFLFAGPELIGGILGAIVVNSGMATLLSWFK